jgi:23S rRNA (adenine2503-C2)-methyltransferase
VALNLSALYGLEGDEIREITGRLGLPDFRGRQLLDWLYKKHIASFDEAKNLPPSVRENLKKEYAVSALHLEEICPSADGESVKYLFRTRDGHFIESVLIVQRGRRTVCVSTQLGCKMGCVFCASGQSGFVRNLTAGEIIEQVVWIEKKTGAAVTNVVFMGMGEPLDNFESVMKALKILQAPWGFGLGARRITVSTVGISPKILEFVRRSEGRVRLSVSLHAAGEDARSVLVPVNRKYSLGELIQTLECVRRELKREITFEYTLIKNVNDSAQDAAKLAVLARRLEAKVNLIPYNPISETALETSPPEAVEKFRNMLERQGVRTTLRRTAGRDIHSACGQLRLDRRSDHRL